MIHALLTSNPTGPELEYKIMLRVVTEWIGLEGLKQLVAYLRHTTIKFDRKLKSKSKKKLRDCSKLLKKLKIYFKYQKRGASFLNNKIKFRHENDQILQQLILKWGNFWNNAVERLEQMP